MGCDKRPVFNVRHKAGFNPRTPYGMRHSRTKMLIYIYRFQSTHPVWDATWGLIDHDRLQLGFNPRTPYGMRPSLQTPPGITRNVSIHAPRMGCDILPCKIQCISGRFQSTHPVWDATLSPTFTRMMGGFQSTHPVWDATIQDIVTPSATVVSIHAPRMGCDPARFPLPRWPARFNPRTPYGMRQVQRAVHGIGSGFNPRTPYGMRLSVDAISSIIT